MPYQIKNGIIYSGNAVTLTQAQYDALTTAEKNNGTVYYIYDSDAMIEAQEVGLDGGNVETLAGSVATFESSPSTAVHAAGEYILYQAQLYKVTSAIAVGEDLTVGSNIEATNLGNELNAGLTEIVELDITLKNSADWTSYTSYPTGFTLDNCYIIGFEVFNSSSFKTGYGLTAAQNGRTFAARDATGIRVYNTDGNLFGAECHVILAKIS